MNEDQEKIAQAWWDRRLRIGGVLTSWAKDANGKYRSQFANDAMDAWQAAQAADPNAARWRYVRSVNCVVEFIRPGKDWQNNTGEALDTEVDAGMKTSPFCHMCMQPVDGIHLPFCPSLR